MAEDGPFTARAPRQKAHGRMEELARLPVFFALKGRRVLIVGGEEPAVWKAELLSAAGARVEVIAPHICEEMWRLAGAAPAGPVAIHVRPWHGDDISGAALAICDAKDDEEAERFAAAARAAGVPVNVVDRPAFCDFSFGTIVNRSPLVVGISTDGAAPVFGQAVRAKIETLLPAGFKAWAEAAKSWRKAVAERELPFKARRAFWERFTAKALAEPNREPTDADRDALIAAIAEDEAPHQGSVTLVGAGPGDPELLTLKAVRVLQSAEVVLYDELVSPAILDFARREAKKVPVGKTGYGPAHKQDDINALIVEHAKEGRRVVRLKGGDPMIFGRASEEIAACRAAGIAAEVVPGISSPQGAASRLLFSLTHRDHAKRVQFVTAHGRDGKLPEDLDIKALADPVATTAIYMPGRTLPDLLRKLIEAGVDLRTPAVAVFSVTTPDEKVMRARLGSIADAIARAQAAGTDGPCLVIYGKALAEAKGYADEAPAAASAKIA